MKTKCDRCGKALVQGKSGPDLPCSLPDGSIVCASCMFRSIKEKTGMDWRDDSEAVAMVQKVKAIIAERTHMLHSSLQIVCEYFAEHDVSITITSTGNYKIVLYTELKSDNKRFLAVMDYLVDWIKTHPIPQTKTQCEPKSPRCIDDDEVLVFFIVLENYPPLDDSVYDEAYHHAVKTANLPKRNWFGQWILLRTIEQSVELAAELKAWNDAQKIPDNLRFIRGNMAKNDMKIPFIIAYPERTAGGQPRKTGQNDEKTPKSKWWNFWK